MRFHLAGRAIELVAGHLLLQRSVAGAPRVSKLVRLVVGGCVSLGKVSEAAMDLGNVGVVNAWRDVAFTFSLQNLCPSRAKSASRSLLRALLTPQVNPGSRYRCVKST